ncbi:MAG: hypothetical protein J7M27_07755 [Candidatus Latescibacteria bacterium]|nr:hypothetical protein [Candidatus Latescibacterota bacterium]
MYRTMFFLPAFLLFFTAVSSRVSAKECDSKLAAHMHEFFDGGLYLGAEWRTFYVFTPSGEDDPKGDGLGQGGRYEEHHFLTGLRLSSEWLMADAWTFVFEGDLRYRDPGWKDELIAGLPEFRPQLRQITLEYNASPFQMVVGQQMLTFGSSALLDQWVVSAVGQMKTRTLNWTVFGGTTNPNTLAMQQSCLWGKITEHRHKWKGLSDSDFGESRVFGSTISLKTLRPYRVKMLYLFSDPERKADRSHALALHASGPLIKGATWKAEPMALYNDDGDVLAGLVTQVGLRGGIGSGRLGATVGYAGPVVRPKDVFFSAVYENLVWGKRQRYSLHDGHLGMVKLDGKIHEAFQPFVHYFIQADPADEAEDRSDELDAGLKFRYGESYMFEVSYAGLNVCCGDAPDHGMYAGMRILL